MKTIIYHVPDARDKHIGEAMHICTFPVSDFVTIYGFKSISKLDIDMCEGLLRAGHNLIIIWDGTYAPAAQLINRVEQFGEKVFIYRMERIN